MKKAIIRSTIFTSLITLGLLSSCNLNKPKYSDMKATKDFIKNISEDDIVFAYTSSLNSKVEPHSDQLIESSKIQYGGTELLYKYITKMRQEINNLLLIDGGQVLDKDYSLGGELTLNEVAKFNYDAILLSDHELINFRNNLLPRELPFINSNLISLDTNTSFEQYANKEYTIKEVAGIKIGIIGLTPYRPKLKKEHGLEGILFDDVVARIIDIKKKISSKTDINIALLHSHDECSDKIDYRFKDCKLKREELKKILERLPPDTIDLVFSGSSIEPVTKILEYPVISNLGHGEFITLVKYNKKTKEIEAKQVRVCSHFYDVADRCYIDPEDIVTIKNIRKSHLKLRPARVFNHPIL